MVSSFTKELEILSQTQDSTEAKNTNTNIVKQLIHISHTKV